MEKLNEFEETYVLCILKELLDDKNYNSHQKDLKIIVEKLEKR